MVRNILASILVLFWLHTVLGLDDEDVYRQLVLIISSDGPTLFVLTLGASLTLLAGSYWLHTGPASLAIHLLARGAFLIGRFAVTFGSLAWMAAGLVLQQSFPADFGIFTVLSPIVLFGASAVAVLQHDFNFPIRETLVEGITWPTLTAGTLVACRFLI
ncbi:MAG: hypothetical protein AB1634_07035 [Thermodesulfobacteriota bacterium]